jgi:hypothetical protein
MLENYRSKHKSSSNEVLPDDITFELVVKEPKKAQKLLEARERSASGKN